MFSQTESIEGYDYQYHLKDHLGNVRLTFSTAVEDFTMVETFESGEYNGFQDLHRHTSTSANTTTGGDEVERLQSGQTGAMVFLSLNKGDTIDLSVHANYESAPSGNTFLGTAFTALFTSFDNNFGSGAEGGGVSSTNTVFGDALNGADMSGKGDATTAPRAFLNYIVFDRNMNYIGAGFDQISTAAQGVGVHDTVRLSYTADRESYILAYLSNENSEPVDIHWDDFTVTQHKTNVVSTQDYYPFGLTFNESVRVASEEQNWKYNGYEFIPQLQWTDFGARAYDATIGRWNAVDPLAETYLSIGPYAYVRKNPVRLFDIAGMADNETLDEWVASKQAEWDALDAGADISDVWGIGASLNSQGDDKKKKKNNQDVNLLDLIDGNADYELGTLVMNEFVAFQHIGDGEFINLSFNPSLNPHNLTGYYYSSADLEVREKLMDAGSNHVTDLILRNELDGIFTPLSSSSYINEINSNSSLAIGGEYMKMMIDLIGSSGDASSYSKLSSGMRNLRRSIRSKNTAFRRKMKSITSGSSSPRNSWNRFLKSRKGRYKGKNWLNQARKDYYKWKTK